MSSFNFSFTAGPAQPSMQFSFTAPMQQPQSLPLSSFTPSLQRVLQPSIGQPPPSRASAFTPPPPTHSPLHMRQDMLDHSFTNLGRTRSIPQPVPPYPGQSSASAPFHAWPLTNFTLAPNASRPPDHFTQHNQTHRVAALHAQLAASVHHRDHIPPVMDTAELQARLLRQETQRRAYRADEDAQMMRLLEIHRQMVGTERDSYEHHRNHLHLHHRGHDVYHHHHHHPHDDNTNRPASNDALTALKQQIMTYKSTSAVSESKLDENLIPTCSICLTDFDEGEFATVMPCAHPYHRECLFTWLKKQNTCPSCRYELMTDDQNYNMLIRWKRQQREREQRDKANNSDSSTSSSPSQSPPLPVSHSLSLSSQLSESQAPVSSVSSLPRLFSPPLPFPIATTVAEHKQEPFVPVVRSSIDSEGEMEDDEDDEDYEDDEDEEDDEYNGEDEDCDDYDDDYDVDEDSDGVIVIDGEDEVIEIVRTSSPAPRRAVINNQHSPIIIEDSDADGDDDDYDGDENISSALSFSPLPLTEPQCLLCSHSSSHGPVLALQCPSHHTMHAHCYQAEVVKQIRVNSHRPSLCFSCPVCQRQAQPQPQPQSQV